MDLPYYICRVSRYYGFTYDYVLDLPLKVFSLYNLSIVRLRAEEDMRHLFVATSCGTGEAAKALLARLQVENGTPCIVEKAMEPNAIDKLRQLSEKMNG